MDQTQIARVAEELYQEMERGERPELKIETLAGQIVMQAAPSWQNSFIASRVERQLAAAYEPGSYVLQEAGVLLPDGSEPRPDVVVLHGLPASNGRLTADLVDVVVEVASQSNSDNNYVTKRRLYAAAGIPEYLIIDPGKGVCTYLAKPRHEGWASMTGYDFGEAIKLAGAVIETSGLPRVS
ncbi:Uma2 family endonuclease [Nonomuraea sp. NPDC050536]|uniref:Uma2 family endonuclease n=1 Tax=Nonomuraea sp. NPDC050536 TaxID=3364366 RepID=UPI0037CC969D